MGAGQREAGKKHFSQQQKRRKGGGTDSGRRQTANRTGRQPPCHPGETGFFGKRKEKRQSATKVTTKTLADGNQAAKIISSRVKRNGDPPAQGGKQNWVPPMVSKKRQTQF